MKSPNESHLSVAHAPLELDPLCEWIERSLRQIPGQDPLGLQTITTDRILPALLPGVLALSTRARYFSFYSFLLRRYAEGAGAADNKSLGDFLRRREFELCVAANLCTRCDAADAIGNRTVRPLVRERPAVYERRFSIKTELGGYGLYYRSPMDELGLVVRAGHAVVEDRQTPIDLLAPGERADAIAGAFEEAVADTRWYRDWIQGIDPIPAEVLEELSEVGCLCRLADHHSERELLRRLLLSAPTLEREAPAEQRRRAIALFLELLDSDEEVAVSTSAFRLGVIESFARKPETAGARGDAYASWAAVAMRECMQESVSSLWHHFCRAGLVAQSFDGLDSGEVTELIHDQLFAGGSLDLDGAAIISAPEEPASEWSQRLTEATLDWSWEALAEWTAHSDNALSGLAALVVMSDRVSAMGQIKGPWTSVASVNGEHQLGLSGMATLVSRQVGSASTVGELLIWAIKTLVIAPHETIATSKLPESTFRFWWEQDKLRFVDNGVWRFDPSGLRRGAIASLATDLGWCDREEGGAGKLTADGEAVVLRVMGA